MLLLLMPLLLPFLPLYAHTMMSIIVSISMSYKYACYYHYYCCDKFVIVAVVVLRALSLALFNIFARKSIGGVCSMRLTVCK